MGIRSHRGPFVHIGEKPIYALSFMCDARQEPERLEKLVDLTQNVLLADDARLYRRKLNCRTEQFSYVQGASSKELWEHSELEFQEKIVSKFPGGIWSQHRSRFEDRASADAAAGGVTSQDKHAPFYYCQATGQQSFWLPANALCILDEFDVFVEPVREEPSRPVSLAVTLGSNGVAETPAGCDCRSIQF